MRYLMLLLVLFIVSCSSTVGKEYGYSGSDIYPYVSINRLNRSFKKCDEVGCTIYLFTYTTIHNPTSNYLKSEVKCTYYWGSYEHGSDKSILFTLAPEKRRDVTFTYLMDVPFNEASTVGVSCDASYTFNSDFSQVSFSRYFDNSAIKMYKTKKSVTNIAVKMLSKK